MKRIERTIGCLPLVFLIVLGLSGLASANQILLDKPVRAAELILFPSVSDPGVYYYVPDKARLATDSEGNMQFSFLRYVQNVRPEAGQPAAGEGEGGGLVHALVALGVTQDQVREAQRELQRIKAGARIEGPVVFKSGKFGLVSSFKDADGKLTTKVVGLGNAPLLDGEKAAVSLQLTKLGSQILWESFQTPTPDISFTFEMAMDGYQSPRRALIEANFDQIYEHKAFGVGVATPYLGAEIKAAFDDLVREGSIKLTQVGSDESLDTLITTAYNKIAEMMFSPMGGTGTASMPSLGAAGSGSTSLLDKASTLLEKRRSETSKENERLRREAEENRRREISAGTGGTSARDSGSAPGKLDASGQASKAEGPRSSIEAKEKGIKPPDQKDPSKAGKLSHEEAKAEEEKLAQKEKPMPSFAAIATYEMKRVRQKGIFKIDLNKYVADTLTLRFDENIGDLRRYRENNNYFRQVNLDDPLYKQREITVAIDGLNAQDFGEYVNFVSVQMRKKHEGGQETFDEVRIDRNNFNQQGNSFRMIYGWKNDRSRERWMEYEYRTQWSFFGGSTLETPWQKTVANALNLTPLYQRRSVELQADPTLLEDSGVRLITTKIYYEIGGKEKISQVTLNPSQGKLSEKVYFMLPGEKFDYGYETTWRLKGQRTVSSGRKTASDAILFVDEVP